MQKIIITCVTLVCIILFIQLIQQTQTEMTVKYFPIDDTAGFEQTDTSLSSNTDTGKLDWLVSSKSETALYLRQDISLLFKNGMFFGIQSKWQENTAILDMVESYQPKESSYLQAITYHHGEIHPKPETITSIQNMTTDEQYILHYNSDWKVITDSEKNKDLNLKKTLKKNTEKGLDDSWGKLLQFYNMKSEDYIIIPFIDLVQYNDKPFPGYSDEKTKQIIGQLWEGLYKNYILELNAKKNQQLAHPMPLILLAKNQKKLFFLYEMNDKKHLLKQNLP